MRLLTISAGVITALSAATNVYAAQEQAPINNLVDTTNLERTQAYKTKAVLDKLIPNPDMTSVGLPAQVDDQTEVEDDGVCFKIDDIQPTVVEPEHANDVAKFGFALLPEIKGAAKVTGQCLSAKDIGALSSRIQNRLIDKGYITSRVLIAAQNLSSGKLLVTLVPGKVGEVIFKDEESKIPVVKTHSGRPAVLASGLSIKSGDVLNLRKLETGLENLQRVPSATAGFEIMPSANEQMGYSDIVVSYSQDKRVRGSLSIDDAGSEPTGKYQGTLTASIDNPTGTNDLFYAVFSRDLGNDLNDYKDLPGSKSSKNYSLGYVVPIKNNLLQLNASHNTYHQTVAGSTQDYLYGGESNNASVRLSHLAGRDSRSKTYVYGGMHYRSSKSDIDGTELEVQRRKTAGYSVGITHETKFGEQGKHSLKTDLSYSRGTGAFDALPAPESMFNEGSARAGVYKLNTQLSSVMGVGKDKKTPVVYSADFSGQYTKDYLVPNDKLAIGGRYTVRGFDGERTLSGDTGAVLRQELTAYPAWMNKKGGHGIYAALDAAYVDNNLADQDEVMLGHHLVGAAIGVRGSVSTNSGFVDGVNYDVFTSKAVAQPEGFSKKDWVSGFSVGVNF